MPDTIQTLILISAVTSAIVTIINTLQRNKDVGAAKKSSDLLHDMVNSRLSELLEVTRLAAHAAGMAEAAANSAKDKLERSPEH